MRKRTAVIVVEVSQAEIFKNKQKVGGIRILANKTGFDD